MAMHRPLTEPRQAIVVTKNQKRSPEMLARFIGALAETANVSEAARRCGITPWLAYYWKARSEDGFDGYTIDMGGEDDEGNPLVAEFHEAWGSALSVAVDVLENEARRRAVDGVEDVIVQKGIQAFVRDPATGELVLDENGKPIPLTIRKYSDGLLTLLLKANRPEKYRENIKADVTVTGGVLAIPLPGVPGSGAPVDASAWAAQFNQQSMKDVTPASTTDVEDVEDAEPVEQKALPDEPELPARFTAPSGFEQHLANQAERAHRADDDAWARATRSTKDPTAPINTAIKPQPKSPVRSMPTPQELAADDDLDPLA